MLVAAGANERLFSKKWTANSFRWVVWKLAAYQRWDPKAFAGRVLTRDNVLDQLKYRRVPLLLAPSSLSQGLSIFASTLPANIRLLINLLPHPHPTLFCCIRPLVQL